MKQTLHPVHPGEVLSEEFLKPMNLSQNRLAFCPYNGGGVDNKKNPLFI